ncbi:MAG: NB-ARC domain-containing protein [Rhodospirillales bacterium]|nr:NB-ARC domain-containing protein [Rhodospirillales bacterium]
MRASWDREDLTDGVYVEFGAPRRVDLLYSDPDPTDFFVPNSGFTGRHFEVLSLVTDRREIKDATPYCDPVGVLPPSETEGSGELDVHVRTFSNLPKSAPDYVNRTELEERLYQEVTNDRHPVITLVGRGGIGKTSLALTVLTRIAGEGFFDVILWFSARD